MKRIVSVLAIGIVLTWQTIGSASTTVDALIQKLTEKGILTDKEATQLKGEIAYEEKVSTEQGYKKQAPDWVQNFKIGGDFRARVQSERRESGSGATHGDRVRARMRARLNLETKVNDKAKVVVGIATDGGVLGSGANNPRSGNYTLGTSTNNVNPFSKPNVVLNKAYGQYMVNDKLTLTAGKMDNPVWEPMEFLWDSDITPEGASAKFDYKFNDMVSLFSTASFFNLGEFNPSTSDPFMSVGQLGLMIKPNEKMDAKVAMTYTGYGNIKNGFTGGNANNSNGTSTLTTGSTALLYKYNAPMAAVDIGFNDPFGDMLPVYIPRIGVFGEFTVNPDPDLKNVAWMAGGYIGNSKVNGWGTWKATAAYKVIEKDAWLDILPDSDFYSGNTAVAGTEGILEIGLAKNMTFALDWYTTHRYGTGSGTAKAPEHLLQYDINWKF